MPDYRSKRQKLEAMANQSVSPHEAAIAKRKLADMDKHPVFRKPGSSGIDWDFIAPKRPQDEPGVASRWAERLRTTPHWYEPYGGSHAMGCRTCGLSRGNKSAAHLGVYDSKGNAPEKPKEEAK